MTEEKKKISLKIKLIQKKTSKKDPRTILTVRDKNEKAIQYARNDLVGLLSLLNKMDTRLHPEKEWKMFLKVKDKLTEAAGTGEVPEEVEVDLTLDEASFLKLYLSEFAQKEGKNSALAEYELRAWTNVRDQFE